MMSEYEMSHFLPVEGRQDSRANFNIPTGNIINMEATPVFKSSGASVEATESMILLAAVADRETRVQLNTRNAMQTKGKSDVQSIA